MAEKLAELKQKGGGGKNINEYYFYCNAAAVYSTYPYAGSIIPYENIKNFSKATVTIASKDTNCTIYNNQVTVATLTSSFANYASSQYFSLGTEFNLPTIPSDGYLNLAIAFSATSGTYRKAIIKCTFS